MCGVADLPASYQQKTTVTSKDDTVKAPNGVSACSCVVEALLNDTSGTPKGVAGWKGHCFYSFLTPNGVMGGVEMGIQRLCASDSVITNRAATHVASWLIRQKRVFSGRSAPDPRYTGNSKIFAQTMYQHYCW
ncbi:MAG TPA: hypothetical protein ENH62_05325 [Marinobacter sp.]|uniref:Uncharacterized protein n=1 Tax=marine sediment metagenome TaxID=412755 RepID=A0A0F9PG12_9ZZZZ|nr:hypothetical protein [Marinobacter sp.]